MKRLFDFVVALLGLVILFVPLLLLSFTVLILLGRPIFFRQIRPGLYGRPFQIIKFRTMTNALDSNGELQSDKMRMTAFGRFLRKSSLDELPELLNVLLGNMSLVGPRPLLMEYLELYTPEQARRHDVRPGVTGWAQVNGRNAISWEQKFELDIWYIDNRSFWLDLKILWFTVFKVIRRHAINFPGEETMSKFNGKKT